MARDLLLIGTHRRAQHTDPDDTAFGIYAAHIGDAAATLAAETPQPGWIVRHPTLPVIYAINEVRMLDGKAGGGVSAFAVTAAGALRALGGRPTPAMPCHCAVDHSGRFLLVATFGGGSVHLFPLARDGTIGAECDAHIHAGASVHPRRQTAPHAHAVTIDPANRFVAVPDLGIDQMLVYALDLARGALRPCPDRTLVLPPASGPRHLAFGHDGRFAYLMNEMSATITVLNYDGATGTFAPIETADLLPDGFAGLRSGAAVLVSPCGRHLYATTRSHGSSGPPPAPGIDALVWFAIDPPSGRLRFGGRILSGGAIPRAAIFDRGGHRLLVAHQATGCVTAFGLDPDTGRPQPGGTLVQAPVPVCLCLWP